MLPFFQNVFPLKNSEIIMAARKSVVLRILQKIGYYKIISVGHMLNLGEHNLSIYLL